MAIGRRVAHQLDLRLDIAGLEVGLGALHRGERREDRRLVRRQLFRAGHFLQEALARPDDGLAVLVARGEDQAPEAGILLEERSLGPRHGDLKFERGRVALVDGLDAHALHEEHEALDGHDGHEGRESDHQLPRDLQVVQEHAVAPRCWMQSYGER
ncbi:hypothetical protein [Phenylobacterium sp. J367]|uniref:hypothetical protein n=1 Tax=Phenylobacterium sp. J367 TaxID=2898435 RepID=UPI0035B47D7A